MLPVPLGFLPRWYLADQGASLEGERRFFKNRFPLRWGSSKSINAFLRVAGQTCAEKYRIIAVLRSRGSSGAGTAAVVLLGCATRPSYVPVVLNPGSLKQLRNIRNLES